TGPGNGTCHPTAFRTCSRGCANTCSHRNTPKAALRNPTPKGRLETLHPPSQPDPQPTGRNCDAKQFIGAGAACDCRGCGSDSGKILFMGADPPEFRPAYTC